MARAIKRHSTRKLGELMAELKAADKLAKAGNPNWVSENPNNPTLSDQGIDKNLAAKARKLAAIPEDKFEADAKDAIADTRARVTTHFLFSWLFYFKVSSKVST